VNSRRRSIVRRGIARPLHASTRPPWTPCSGHGPSIGAQRIDDLHTSRLDRRQEAADETHRQCEDQRGRGDAGRQPERKRELRERLKVGRGDRDRGQEAGGAQPDEAADERQQQ
jgi:hypothetical protein